MSEYGLHWFRRDLRIEGNPAFLASHRRCSGRVLGVFFFDSAFLARPDFSVSRFAFFLETLAALRDALRARGGDLLVLDAQPHDGFQRLVEALRRGPLGRPRMVSFNRDYEPFACRRDVRVKAVLASLGVEVLTARDHLLIEPAEFAGPSSGAAFYKVYTPFARKWFEMLRTPEIRQRLDAAHDDPGPCGLTWDRALDPARRATFADALERFRAETARRARVPLPAAGAGAARARLEGFRGALSGYRDRRDRPAESGTSGLSVYLKNGSLTTAQIMAELGLADAAFESDGSPTKYLKELVWREFYYHVLWHCPRVETEAFIEKYKAIEWENDERLFEAWKAGETGYPLVDAGMRELRATGRMHNRVRMVVASFLTKDLLIDWRWGERYFMEQLLDGDLAPNNGGWQWAASTGCDPQPYFRVFNPVLQSERFDADGAYIMKWVPEARDLAGRVRHEPSSPIVEHASRKTRAMLLYSRCP